MNSIICRVRSSRILLYYNEQCFILTFSFFISLGFFSVDEACGQQIPISKDFLTGRHNYRENSSFIKVPDAYATKTAYLQKETYSAFLRMRQAALKEGINLTIISGTRSFGDQKYIWERKWNSAEYAGINPVKLRATKILRWSSMPGTSRHHWGTDMDLTSLTKAYYTTAKGKKMYAWMLKNAHKYGFYQPYTAKRNGGYEEEKWHWSYLPLAKVYLDEYIKRITYTDISGFKGSDTAKELDIIRNWVLGINEECK